MAKQTRQTAVKITRDLLTKAIVYNCPRYTRNGGDADDSAIIEELHNRVIKQSDEIERLKKEKAALVEKISKNHLGDILQAVNMLKDGLTERKKKTEKVERALDMIVIALAKIE